ncbi:hypothetical protein CRM22_005164 [Opisthorchis felineus]|uniref:Uncharacterized protein n=1 Tax=Opisthorchis felineus TaxID=147828 RepID=A0A4S2LSE7_OPIFE|nr:hypothetical protein CRM22_005164 [Opisthorchis felineus]
MPLESVFDQNQCPGESADEYADALHELAAKTCSEDSQNVHDVRTTKGVTAGVRNSDRKAEFRQKGDRALCGTLQLARIREHVNDSKNSAPSTVPLLPPAQGQWQAITIPIEFKPNSQN